MKKCSLNFCWNRPRVLRIPKNQKIQKKQVPKEFSTSRGLMSFIDGFLGTSTSSETAEGQYLRNIFLTLTCTPCTIKKSPKPIKKCCIPKISDVFVGFEPVPQTVIESFNKPTNFLYSNASKPEYLQR